MRSPRFSLMFLMLFISSLSAVHAFAQTLEQPPASRPEEIEWTWEVRPSHVDARLPNVLLVGDSITRNYFPEVQRQLANVANVYLFASSASVGDPSLPHQLAEFAAMDDVPYKVVHFNNGMHGWTYTESEYKQAFPSFLTSLRAIAPKASFIWASTTPVKVDKTPGPTNARVLARNSIALTYVNNAGIPLDDQHELMSHHLGRYEDDVHFNPAGAAIQGQQAAQTIRTSLVKITTVK
jgi:GDSL-like Lipase/Acylhydrolase family